MPYRHAATRAAYLRQRRAELRAEGRCQWCKKPAPPSPKDPTKHLCVCDDCRKKKNKECGQRRKKIYALNKKLGVCVVCGVRPSIKATCPGETDLRCGVCYEAQSDYKDTHREEIREKNRNRARRRTHAA